MIDLASEAVGGRVVSCTDDFFAPVANLLKVKPPVWKADEYTDRGKWMDGWESKRRRDEGHDWCELALGIPGRIERVTVDTSHFTGNYPESFSLEACGCGNDDELADSEWVEIIGRTTLEGDAVATFDVAEPHRITHVRLRIFPDGGVARLRIEGEPIPAAQEVCPWDPVNLASVLVGAEAIAASDVHYSPPSNLLLPTASRGMWDGWETKRRRGPGHDWVEIRLGLPGDVESFEIDTTHFKGNAPGWVSVDVSDDGDTWVPAVKRFDIAPDEVATANLPTPTRAAYVRLNIHPDGGLARFRVLGHPEPASAAAKGLGFVNALFVEDAMRWFTEACASSAWVGKMTSGRPYPSISDLFDDADHAFDELEEKDWLEAFAGHPRIGEPGDAVANREQSSVRLAQEGVRADLTDVNRAYEDRFGFTYIVYASGKTADEMLAIAKDRLDNDRTTEIAKAAGEQRRITSTRLRRMLCLEHP